MESINTQLIWRSLIIHHAIKQMRHARFGVPPLKSQQSLITGARYFFAAL
jgi:hypothetical protein